MPVFYRHRAQDSLAGVIALRIFALREGVSCVVSWPIPEPGLRVFSPTPTNPEIVDAALPYAQYLSGISGLRVAVEMDPGIEWQPAWGELLEWKGQ